MARIEKWSAQLNKVLRLRTSLLTLQDQPGHLLAGCHSRRGNFFWQEDKFRTHRSQSTLTRFRKRERRYKTASLVSTNPNSLLKCHRNCRSIWLVFNHKMHSSHSPMRNGFQKLPTCEKYAHCSRLYFGIMPKNARLPQIRRRCCLSLKSLFLFRTEQKFRFSTIRVVIPG